MEEKKKQPIEAYICAGLLFALVVVVGVEVVARYIFQSSFSWSNELARFIFIWFTFIGGSYAVVLNAHIVIEALHTLFPEKIRPGLELVGDIVWVIFSIFIAYVGFTYCATLMSGLGNNSAAMDIPIAYIYVSIPIGYLLMAFRMLQILYKKYRKKDCEGVKS